MAGLGKVQLDFRAANVTIVFLFLKRPFLKNKVICGGGGSCFVHGWRSLAQEICKHLQPWTRQHYIGQTILKENGVFCKFHAFNECVCHSTFSSVTMQGTSSVTCWK